MKIVSEKCIWVSNLSDICARFNVITKEPFEVQPKKSVVAPKETLQLTVSFKAACCGDFKDEMLVCYETGEKLYIQLKAHTKEANVYLERAVLVFNDTYEGLSHQKDVKLYNKSRYTVRYQWKMFGSFSEEKKKFEDLKYKWQCMKECENMKGNKLEECEVIDFDGHCRVYERIYNDEIEEFQLNEPFLYRHSIFKIEPLV